MFERPQEKQEKTHNPHPDAQTNVKYWLKKVNDIYWVAKNLYEIDALEGQKFINWKVSKQGHGDEQNLVITYGIKYKSKQTYCISIHQSTFQFRCDVCSMLNSLIGQGFIQHRTRFALGQQRQVPLPEQEIDTEGDCELRIDHPANLFEVANDK